MSDRDPRVDPKPGDELRDSFGIECRVTAVNDGVVTREQRGQHLNLDLEFWQGWYRDARILKHGDTP